MLKYSEQSIPFLHIYRSRPTSADTTESRLAAKRPAIAAARKRCIGEDILNLELFAWFVHDGAMSENGTVGCQGHHQYTVEQSVYKSTSPTAMREEEEQEQEQAAKEPYLEQGGG